MDEPGVVQRGHVDRTVKQGGRDGFERDGRGDLDAQRFSRGDRTRADGDLQRHGLLGAGGARDARERQRTEHDEENLSSDRHGVSVTRVGDSIVLNMPGNITFATDSSNISADFYQVLDSVALVINEFEKTYVDVIGHTDSTGKAEYNQQLSVARAGSVARYLESQKVLPQRINTQGMGLNSPIASNDTPEGRALNRRVEIRLTPIT